MSKNKKYEHKKNPIRINEIIRKEYPLLAERIDNVKNNKKELSKI